MIERLKDCLCHPRYIGKYNKDSLGTVFLTVFIFIILCFGMQAARCYTDEPFDDSSSRALASKLIQYGKTDVIYDAESNTLTGTGFDIEGDGYSLIVLPLERMNFKGNMISIVLKESTAEMYYCSFHISTISYKDILVESFTFDQVANNVPKDSYSFKILIHETLASSNLFFQSFSFVQSIVSTLVYFIICLIFSYIMSIAINPTIDRGVRAKLCMYDTCIFLVGSMFSYLFNVGMIVYFALAMPMIYTLITFRHVVKVVIRR